MSIIYYGYENNKNNYPSKDAKIEIQIAFYGIKKSMIKTELLTIKEVQDMLGVSRSKVYEFINSSKNPLPIVYISERLPRVKAKDLERWVESQK